MPADTQGKIPSVWDFVSKAEDTSANLADVYHVIQILCTELDTEGYQPEDRFEDWKAVAFARKVPLYLSLINLILDALERANDNLTSAIDAVYEHRKELTNA